MHSWRPFAFEDLGPSLLLNQNQSLLSCSGVEKKCMCNLLVLYIAKGRFSLLIHKVYKIAYF